MLRPCSLVARLRHHTDLIHLKRGFASLSRDEFSVYGDDVGRVERVRLVSGVLRGAALDIWDVGHGDRPWPRMTGDRLSDRRSALNGLVPLRDPPRARGRSPRPNMGAWGVER